MIVVCHLYNLFLGNHGTLQENWIKESYRKKSYYHWLILFKKKPIGFISVNEIDMKKLETTWSWYIGEEKYSALGGYIPPYFYNWVFYKLKMNKIYANVFEKNYNVIQIHKLHGYKSSKKVYFKKKNKKNIKYVKMFLLKQDWNFKKYSKYTSDFPILKWQKNKK